MSKSTRVRAILSLSLAVIFGVWSAARAADTFRFGVVTPLSGGAADYGIAFQDGIKMAVEEANAAGGVTVGGKNYTIEPIFCDDEFKPDKAVNCGKELSAQYNVRAILTPSSLAAFPMMGFNQQEHFLLMATSQTPKFTQMGNKLVVRFVNNTDRTMGPWAQLVEQYLQKNNKPTKKAAIMVVNTELGKSWADNFAKAWPKVAGGSITGTASYDANAADFYPQLSTLLPAQPDLIVLTTVCQPSAIVIKQARELGFKGTFINSAACSGEELIKLLPPEQLDGTLVEVGAWGVSNKMIDDFKAAYLAKFKVVPQNISGEGYDGARWLIKAIEIAGSVDDAARIRAAMPTALAGLKNMFNMSNLNAQGDLDFPMYVGVISGGKLSGFSGANP